MLCVHCTYINGSLAKMQLFQSQDQDFVDTISQLAYCNPFRRDRIDLERKALGAEFDETQADWNVRAGGESKHPNVEALLDRCLHLLDHCREKLAQGAKPTERDVERFEDLVLLVIYHQYRDEIDQMTATGTPTAQVVYRSMQRTFSQVTTRWPRQSLLTAELPHLFAGFVQIRRAYSNIFRFIVGVSKPAIAIRAAVWESIFTHDMRRYRQIMFRHLGDFATLITGPSGTGKELVARAIGLSRYVPFDAKSTATDGERDAFFPISLAAMSPTLVESELFGHARGAFTGAVVERKGWLETCPASGAVFLDEIGELEPAIQVKLLRVLQSREFSRLGETRVRRFPGKIIAATNRNLADEMQAHRFREDLYYRLCSDIVEVPSLAERIADDPAELHELVAHLVGRIVGDGADALVDEILQAIDEQLGTRYSWPGNVRELEQCVRNLLVRRRYLPPRTNSPAAGDPFEQLAEQMRQGQITADDLIRRYCQLDHARTGSYEATARRLALDRRTVKARVVATAD